MTPQLQQLIDQAAEECNNAGKACIFTASGKKKCVQIITGLVEKVVKELEDKPATEGK
jgi:putative heme degradation protein